MPMSRRTLAVSTIVGLVLWLGVFSVVVKASGLLSPSSTPPSVTTSSTVVVTTTTSPPSTTTSTVPASTTVAPARPVAAVQAPWPRLADCESGKRWKDARGLYTIPVPGSADWSSTSDGYEGGVHFDHGTWITYRSPAMPTSANLATVADQITVAERVLAAQGWGAWPACSRLLGLR